MSINLENLGRLFWKLPYSHWTENLQSLQPRAGAFHHPWKEDKPWANAQLWPFQGMRSSRSPAAFEMRRAQCSFLNRDTSGRVSWPVQHSAYPRPELCTSSWTLGETHWSISNATNIQTCLKSYSSLLAPALLPCCCVNIWGSPASRRPTLLSSIYTRSTLNWTVSLIRSAQENYKPVHVNVWVVLCVFTYFCINQLNKVSHTYITLD